MIMCIVICYVISTTPNRYIIMIGRLGYTYWLTDTQILGLFTHLHITKKAITESVNKRTINYTYHHEQNIILTTMEFLQWV